MYIGIDPGKTGAAVLYSENSGVVDWIDYEDPLTVANKLRDWTQHDITLAILEKVHAMPKQGVSTTFKFGANYGVWQGVLAALKIPHELITPRTWQKGLITKSDGKDTKERSLNVARRFFPSSDFLRLKKHHNRADAALMAVFASRRKG